MTVIPVVNPEMTSRFLPLFIGFVGITILKEACKLIWRVWSKRLAVVSVICNAIAIGLASLIFANPDFWNLGFAHQLLGARVATASSATGILQKFWPILTRQFIYIIVIAYLIDTGQALYRGFLLSRTSR